jgi:murein L,D-transpeptidase YafK
MKNTFVKMLVIGLAIVVRPTIGPQALPRYAHFDPAKIEHNLRPDLEARGFDFGAPIFVRIFKQSSELELWLKDRHNNWKLFANYPICNFSGVLGPKLKEGDQPLPEGFIGCANLP